jgi:sulfopyruvate decarboxylase TPP-binding subunit
MVEVSSYTSHIIMLSQDLGNVVNAVTSFLLCKYKV